MANITRKNFLAASAVTAGLIGLAGCDTTGEGAGGGSDPLAAPAADAYPIDPDGEDVEAKWTSEASRKDKWTKVTNPDGGAELGVMDTAKIIQVNGYAFKDLNGNGKLDLYEDWRQPAADRAASLASSLTAEECVPLMFHGDFSLAAAEVDEDQAANLDKGQRAGVIRGGGDADSYPTAVDWTNDLQSRCEAGPYGIPYWNSTDPYMFHNIPDDLTIAATFDPEVARKAADYVSRGWRAVGITCDLGPQLDVSSTPVYSRFSGTFGEDPALNRDLGRAYVDGLQSTYDEDGNDLGWGKNSVMGMMKHYPSDGACEGGRNSHNVTGKYAVYPNDGLGMGLIPFIDGAVHLDGKTETIGSVMPYYAIPYTEDERYGENVAAAYNGYVLGILRNAGWDGVICTDWQISQETYFDGAFPGRHFGVDDLTPVERLAKGYLAGTDEFGGEFQYEQGLEALKLLQEELGEDGALERVQASARRLFKAELDLGLFENPYVDRDTAAAYFEDTSIDDWSAEILPKCVVMLKNAGGVISERGEKPTVYVPMEYTAPTSGGGFGGFGGPGGPFGGGEPTPGSWDLPVDQAVLEEHFTLVTDTLGEPTADDGGYAETDIVRASADEIAACDMVLVFASGPTMGEGSRTNEDGTVTYLPMNLQYNSYTADGPNVRQTSIAGDTLEDGSKENRSYYGQTNEGNTTELEKILSTAESAGETPVVVAMSSGNPMIFSEFEDKVDVILYTPNATDPASIAKIVAGEIEPSGLLPYQMPKDMDTVEANDEDAPRDCEPYVDSEGNEYDFAFGLNWAGVISDERVATYKVDPLTTLETAEL
ncbi:MAG TPA: glycoside hydrolase family 3 C-terminal domain-containing protein [Candidatus Olsenella pullicola]|nr:glycoside hydrolase family 3 C-terminal domain-containing protein [Candidatus Olsenella pullicola]